jgi:CcmD family protein
VHPDIAQALATLQQMTLAVEAPTLAIQTAQTDFIPASQLPAEVLPATPFVFIAYAFVWVALIGYLFGLWRKVTRVERELGQVVSRVEGRKAR